MNSESIVQTYRLLQQHQLLPSHVDCSVLAEQYPMFDNPMFDNLLPVVRDAWTGAADQPLAGQQRRAAERMIRRLEHPLAGDAAFTCGVPGTRSQQVQESLGSRLVYWPRGIPPGERIGIISSRLGRALEKNRAWFAVLRDCCDAIDPLQAVLITAEKTTTCPFLQRCCELFQVPLLQFTLPAARESITRWLQRQLDHRSPGKGTHTQLWLAAISPPLSLEPDGSGPARDRLILAASEHIVVLKMRRGGHVEQLTRLRLESEENASAISLAIGPNLVPKQLAAKFPGVQRLVPTARTDKADRTWSQQAAREILSLAQVTDLTEYLTHCTAPRGRTLARPDDR